MGPGTWETLRQGMQASAATQIFLGQTTLIFAINSDTWAGPADLEAGGGGGRSYSKCRVNAQKALGYH